MCPGEQSAETLNLIRPGKKNGLFFFKDTKEIQTHVISMSFDAFRQKYSQAVQPVEQVSAGEHSKLEIQRFWCRHKEQMIKRENFWTPSCECLQYNLCDELCKFALCWRVNIQNECGGKTAKRPTRLDADSQEGDGVISNKWGNKLQPSYTISQDTASNRIWGCFLGWIWTFASINRPVLVTPEIRTVRR